MKKMNLFLTVIFTIFAVQFGISQGITGTSHDFSGSAWNTTGELCIVCHTPHNADMTVTTAPLWNHKVTAVAAYQTYTSSTLDATDMGQPNDESKLCLSCHDGTVALENFGGVTTGTNVISSGNPTYVGTDLRNDHPISFTYDATLAGNDGGLYNPTTTNSGLGSTITNDMLFGGKLQCATCHNVHDNSNGAFLRVSNAASALCLTCHNK